MERLAAVGFAIEGSAAGAGGKVSEGCENPGSGTVTLGAIDGGGAGAVAMGAGGAARGTGRGTGIDPAGWIVGRGFGPVVAAGRGVGTAGAGVSATPFAGRGGDGVTVPAPEVPAGVTAGWPVAAGWTDGPAGAAVAAAGRGGAIALSKSCSNFLRVLGEMLMPAEPGAGAGAGAAVVPEFPVVPAAS